MIYGQIYTQNFKSVFVKQITYLKLKFDEEDNLWKIKAHFSRGKKTTLGKYEDERCAKVIFESVSLFAGQDIYNPDSAFDLLKDRENTDYIDKTLNLFSSSDGHESYCRFYIPDEEDVEKYLAFCSDKSINPYITDKLQYEYKKDHPHHMFLRDYMNDKARSEKAETQKSKGIVNLGKHTLDDIRKTL